MTVTLVMTEKISAELLEAAASDVESAGVLLAKYVKTPDGNFRLLVREIHWVPDDAYLLREATALSVASHGYVPFLALAEADGCVPIWLHTHPGPYGSPRPSEHDDFVDEQLAGLFRLRSCSDLYGAVVVAGNGERLCFTGHIEAEEMRTDIDRLWVTGSRFYLARNWLHETGRLPELYDRNVRAFGGDVQRVIGDLRVAVIGCGGTGSAVIEQLVRLGVRRIHVFDPDTLTISNLTRVHGSFPEDVGVSKAAVSAAHAARIAPDAEVRATEASVTSEVVARQLLDADVIFGCTDDNAGRLVLSRIATYLLTPVIDCGVVLSSGLGGMLEGIFGRVTVLAPGTACLVCRNRIDLQRAAAELMPPDEHQRLAEEGYAPALGGIEPAVVAFTTQVAAVAVSELLERLIHYGPEPVATEVILRVHDREVSANHQDPGEGHYCHPGSGKTGLGVTEPFLEQLWHR